MRAHIRSSLEAADGGWRPGERAKEAANLFDDTGLLTESLALLIVAEHSLGAWHELRIAHVRRTEPEHMGWTLEDARVAIAAENEDDQVIVDALQAVSDRLTTPLSHDGLAPWQRPELEAARVRLDDLACWFADQRTLDVLPLREVRFPSAKESFQSIVRDVTQLTGRSLDAARRLARLSPPAPAIGPGDSAES